jgi:predicted Zn finger-like uncharacterized protein
MKIVCDTCGTRYSIDDGRVAGRSFKVRCKQCAHVIVLPGSRAPTAEPAAPRVWHAVIDGIPRPIAVEDLRQLRVAGELDDRTLVWREGLDDWRELGSVAELRGAAPASVVIAPELGPEGAPARRSDAAIEGATGGAAGGASGAGADARTDAEPEHRAQPAPLRGVRHENSVLFSLGNLARLAGPAPATASATGRTEGSGLLDIRELARSLASARTERSSTRSVELPVHGALPFSEPAVLIPSSPPRRDRRLRWALAATAGALVVVTVILLVIVMRGDPAAHAGTPPAPPAVPGASPPTDPGGAPGAPASREVVAHAEPTTADSAAASAQVAAPSMDQTERIAPAPSADRTGRTTGPSVDRTEPAAGAVTRAETAAAAHAGPAAEPGQTGHTAALPARAGSSAVHAAPTAPDPHDPPADAASRRAAPRAASRAPAGSAEACSEVTCIVNGYADPCCAIHRSQDAAPAPAGGGELPERLDRPAIAGGLARIDTSGCGKQSPAHGDVKVSVQVSPAGAVTGATVKSSPDPTLGACVTAALRKGAFPATRRGGSFGYAWRF